MTRRLALPLAAIVLIAVMLALVPWLTRALGPGPGYLASFLIYWFAFCLPLGWLFQDRLAMRVRLGLKLGKHRWVPWAVAALAGVITIAGWVMRPDDIPWLAVPLAALFGLVNGFCEEFFWRGTWLEQGRGNLPYQVLGVGLFTLWHVPLALAHGVIYDGGPAALIGGALVFGAFWSVIANKTGRIGWAVISHVLTNAIAFIGLIAVNFL